MRKSDAFCVQPNSQKCVTFRHFSGFFGKFSKIIKNHQFEHSRTISKGCFHQRYWQTKISIKNKMQAPKEKRNEQMTLAHRKYFVNFIRSGGNYKSFRAEYLRIFKKETSRSTFTRLKRDSEKILNAETHREKRVKIWMFDQRITDSRLQNWINFNLNQL